MKWLLVILMLGVATAAGRAGSKTEPVAYYVQLIRGSDQDHLAESNGKRIHPHLAEAFHSVFKWKTYWEISSRHVELEAGRATRVRLNPEREVEIDLTDPSLRAVTAFLNGKRIQRTVSPRSEQRTLIGGDRDGNSAWFIVVSRNSPNP
jgi:hypothetical protein